MSRSLLPRFSFFTLIILVNTAGLLIWANFSPRDRVAMKGEFMGVLYRENVRGWPFHASYESRERRTDRWNETMLTPETNIKAWILNASVALLILFTAVIVTEATERTLRESPSEDPEGEST